MCFRRLASSFALSPANSEPEIPAFVAVAAPQEPASVRVAAPREPASAAFTVLQFPSFPLWIVKSFMMLFLTITMNGRSVMSYIELLYHIYRNRKKYRNNFRKEMKCVIIVVHFIHYSVGMKLVEYLFNLLLCLKCPYRTGSDYGNTGRQSCYII